MLFRSYGVNPSKGLEEMKQSKNEKHASEVVEMIESSIINGQIPARFLYNREGQDESLALRSEAQLDKMHRAEYLTL